MSKISKEALADLLDGMQITSGINKQYIDLAKESGLVIVYGQSDDLIEFRGALDEELGCYGGGKFYLTNNGILQAMEEYCERCTLYALEMKKAKKLEAGWCQGEWNWSYYTDMSYEKFCIFEEENKYCEGIIFELNQIVPDEVEQQEEGCNFCNELPDEGMYGIVYDCINKQPFLVTCCSLDLKINYCPNCGRKLVE